MKTLCKPVIGITTTQEDKNNRQELDIEYIAAAVEGGGLPVMLPTVGGSELCREYIDMIDGLLLSGGQDILPNQYGEESIDDFELNWNMTPERDAFEMELTRIAIARQMPILGICRGLQMLAVANGGILYQDINLQVPRENPIRHYQKSPFWYASHKVKIKSGSVLSDIFQSDHLETNSCHHQSVKTLPDGYAVTAFSADGIVEAIENTAHNFTLGIQWHPERLLVKNKNWVKLFTRFCEESARYHIKRKAEENI